MNKDPFDLINEDLKIDEKFNSIDDHLNEKLPSGWTYYPLLMPRNFLPLFEKTLQSYKTIRETSEDFPAFEAMIIEAKNSLGQFNE